MLTENCNSVITTSSTRLFDYNDLPLYFRNAPRFVIWERRKKNGDERFSKIPIEVRTGKGAFAGEHRSDSWAGFKEALARLESSNGQYAGLGLDLSIGMEIGIDFDGCVEKKPDGKLLIDPEVQEKLKELNSYTEFSPSCFFDDEARGGIKVFLRGEAPQEDDPKRPPLKRYRNVSNAPNHQGVEIHAQERFYTLTNKPVPGCPQEIRQLMRAEVDALYYWAEKWRRPNEQPVGNSSTVYPPLRGQKRNDLLEGKWEGMYRSSSEALCQLINSLVIEAGGDILKAEQDFFQTGFYKNVRRGNGKPWSEDWPRLREGELAQSQRNAFRYFQNLHRQTRHKKEPEPPPEMLLERADQINRAKQTYLWKPYLPTVGLVHFGGMSSEGKSPVLTNLCARITSGQAWPDGGRNGEARSCLLLSAEDDWPTVVLPRFDLARGDSSRLYRVRMTRIADKDNQSEIALALNRDFTQLVEAVKKIPDLALVAIDPITGYLGGAKMNADEEVRPLLNELVVLSQKLGFVIVTIGHLNRREKGTHPLYRMMGAGAFHSVPRFVYAFGPDDESDSDFAHVIAQARGTLHAPSLRYHTELDGDVVGIGWDGISTATAEDVVDSKTGGEKSKIVEAAQILKEFLKSGMQSAKACYKLLKDNGLSGLNGWEVRKRAGVETTAKGGKDSYWFLRDEQTPIVDEKGDSILHPPTKEALAENRGRYEERAKAREMAEQL